MATFEKRIGLSGKTTWRVRVRRRSGAWLTKSFAKKSTAEEWARNIEHKLDVGDHVPTSEARRALLRRRRARRASRRMPRFIRAALLPIVQFALATGARKYP